MQWNFVRHDPGETEATLAAEYDAVEDEPEPCAIDTWARGAIPSKVRVAVGAVPSGSRPNTIESKASLAPSEAGRSMMSRGRSVRSMRSKRPGTNRSVASSGSRGRGGANDKKNKQKEYIVVLDPIDSDGRKTVASRTLTAQQKAQLKKIHEIEKKEKEQRERERKRTEEERVRKEMAKKLEEDIKGKVYHIERDGSVIIEQPVNAKIFKKRTIKPQVSVESLISPQAPPAMINRRA